MIRNIKVRFVVCLCLLFPLTINIKAQVFTPSNVALWDVWCYYHDGYWTGKPASGRLGFGFGISVDGLNWKQRPSPELDWSGQPCPYDEIEVAGVERFGHKYYAFITAYGGPDKVFDILTFTADNPQGPFKLSLINTRILPSGLKNGWFPGFFQSPDGMLVSHFSMTPARIGFVTLCSMAPLKRPVAGKDGAMRLVWWNGNNALKGKKHPISFADSKMTNDSQPVFVDDTLDMQRGTILEGVITFSKNTQHTPNGIILECNGGKEVAIEFVSSSVTLAGKINSDGSNFEPDQTINRELPIRAKAQFRLLVRHGLLELYLNDYLFNIYQIPGNLTGRIGFLNGASGISKPGMWTMTLPDQELPK